MNEQLFKVVVQSATKKPEGGQVLAFSEERGNRKTWEESLRRHFRFRWLDVSYLPWIPEYLDRFLSYLKDQSEFERAWREEVRPGDVTSPLILPKPCFLTKLDHLWNDAAAVAPARSQKSGSELNAVKALIERFIGSHRPRPARYWCDADGLIFKHDGSRPAGDFDPELWNWKLSWRLPDRFHYDVTHDKGHPFDVYDLNGAPHSVRRNGYINIDCFGNCRRGSG